ncbi:hypothetical protein EXIGLDRAFT_76670 [Exidia glandulosa HHB12029]|uniref:Uncharacterized protein n=1 Tax=Exidia glandulosa HHB12029 TaxID=1314781 RepID=A0A165HRB0_EXIGL|nr:hypothetical protein EXIGLDRAFT_76670 [Exidia glandulosa HHB12029]
MIVACRWTSRVTAGVFGSSARILLRARDMFPGRVAQRPHEAPESETNEIEAKQSPKSRVVVASFLRRCASVRHVDLSEPFDGLYRAVRLRVCGQLERRARTVLPRHFPAFLRAPESWASTSQKSLLHVWTSRGATCSHERRSSVATTFAQDDVDRCKGFW